ncbi:MFS transporter [Amnibacterium setariae]|uniref:MFS transporter n=2 Tax=Amnibacterium setariae TaxID=2306585 RepID=A0A3A1U7I8_9MICO|nr:MFS transporter [Amnibacterium setariae]
MLAAAVLASFVSFLDGSITNIALPSIGRDLGGGVVTQEWVVDGYLLTLSAFILLSGAVSDRFGRLKVLRIALVAFAATSVLCALAPTAGVLVAARLLQGVAGALLVPGSLGLIIAVFSGPAQARAIGSWTGWTSVSSLFGPVVGGLLVDALGWRSVFVIGLLPAAAAMVLLGRVRDDPQQEATGRIDLPSAALAAAGLGLLTVGLIEVGGASHAVLPIGAAIALIAAGLVVLAGFVLQDSRARHPLVPQRLFAERNFSAGNLATLFVYGALGLASLVPALYLQQVLRLPATAAALVSLPSTILMILLSSRFGALSGRLGPRRFMTAGPLVCAVGALLWLLTGLGTAPVVLVAAGTVVVGLGLAMTVAPLTSAVLGAVPEAESGIGSAVNNAVARVAGLVTTACSGLILGGAVAQGGFERAAVVVAVLLVIGGAVSFAGIRDGAARA